MDAVEDGYLRFPALHRDRIVFVAEDDLWSVPTSGGAAHRLTAGVAEATHPRFSPDGRRIAFVGREEGPADVYVMDAGGSPTNRLTFEGNVWSIVGWTSDGIAIQYTTGAARAFESPVWFRQVGAEGGLPRDLDLGPGTALTRSDGGALVLGRGATREPAQWKRYRGGLAGALWIAPGPDADFHRLIDLDGNLTGPCWVGDRVFFLSDHEGVGNVYSCDAGGGGLRRHSDHDDFYARNLSGDGRRLVYHAGARLYLLDPDDDGPRAVPVRLPSSRTQRNRRFVPASQHLDGVTLAPDGLGLAITTRGKAFSFANWEGAVSQHGSPDGIRYRLLTWLNDRLRLVAAANGADGPECLVVLRADSSEPRTLDGLDTGRIVELEVGPVGDLVAISNHRNELLLADLGGDTPSIRTLDRSECAPLDGIAWSPDGRWIAYAFADTPASSVIKVCRVESGESWPVTSRVRHDRIPTFDPKARYLYFLGARNFDPVYDELQFELSFPRPVRPYAIALRPEVPDPFAPRPRPLRGGGETPAGEHQDGVPAVEIELEGITDRIVAFPVEPGRYAKIRAVGEKVLYSDFPLEGTLGHDWWQSGGSRGSLECYDLEKQRQERLADGVGDFDLSRDRSTLFYRSGDRLRVIAAGEKVPEGDEPGRESGWIDLDRVRVSVQPSAEWRQMFQEAWRLQREQFWVEDISGVDWDEVHRRYLPLVDLVGTRSEFSDLLWELQGELGTSHAYEIGGEYRSRPDYRQGYLGADWEYRAEAGGYAVRQLVGGDPWDRDATSPLAAAGADVRTGDVLLAINGQPLSERITPGERLVNQAGNLVALLVRRPGEEHARTLTVRALPHEQRGRYRDWVEGRRRLVREATGGRVGYLHIPDMGPWGFSQFHRGFLLEYECDALIVDVRANGGGDNSSLLLEKLARRRLGYDFGRWIRPEPYPRESPAGPLVAITNEWAGSDGDIFSHAFKMMALGPLIGTRTWGGVIGIWPRHLLADGTVTTQPEFSFFFDDVGWGVENHGTDPDIEVENAPHDYRSGVDAQLERGIAIALELLLERPPHRPRQTQGPRRTSQSLPPRLRPEAAAE
ncbi:MAG TPA: S41 family peptidase [Candidatus Dormibacteraeota bacterium]|jgi:tricorn protease|nr:S41 family peptidase [Candidatus Dormibacteraeota bacterium]